MDDSYEYALIKWAHKYKAYERASRIRRNDCGIYCSRCAKRLSGTARFLTGLAWTCFAGGRSTLCVRIATVVVTTRCAKSIQSSRPSLRPSTVIPLAVPGTGRRNASDEPKMNDAVVKINTSPAADTADPLNGYG